MLPEWRFFAPSPATHDYVVLVRFRGRDTPPGQVALLDLPKRTLRSIAFSPSSRLRKVTRDAIDSVLSAAAAGQRGATLEASPGYETVLALARTRTRLPHGEFMQFMIVIERGSFEPELALASRWHHLAQRATGGSS
jgi:hypothetical protein